MALYSLHPARRRTQMITDVLVGAWVVGWIALGLRVFFAIDDAAEPGRRAQRITEGLVEDMDRIVDAMAGIALIGGPIAGLMSAVRDKVAQLAVVTDEGTSSLVDVGGWIGLGLALTPTVLMLAVHLPRRIAFARNARNQVLASPYALALRALSTQPAHVLASLGPDIVARWQRGDADAITQLAVLQAQWDGVRLPPQR